MLAPPYPLTVTEKVLLAPRHLLLRLDASGCPFGERHTGPGQYALMGWQRESLYPIALASAPRARPLEVLIGSATDEEHDAACAHEGPFWASDPQGRGFPLERARGRPLLLFAGGSAIGALRGVIESVLMARDAFGPVTLYYGVRTSDLFCFREHFDAWRARGIEVVCVVSQEPNFDGARGYVQDALPDTLEGAKSAIAFVCGRPEMERDVAAALLSRGVDGARVFKNWP